MLMLIIHLPVSAIQNDNETQDETLYNEDMNSQTLNTNPAELPVWSIGDFWEYNMTIKFTTPGCVLFCIDVNRMDIVVVDDDYDGESPYEYPFLHCSPSFPIEKIVRICISLSARTEVTAKVRGSLEKAHPEAIIPT